MDEIDQILLTDAPLEPTPRLAREVMRAVRGNSRGLTFPWRYACSGIIVLVALVGCAFAAPQGRVVQMFAQSLVLWSALVAAGCVLFLRVVLDASER